MIPLSNREQERHPSIRTRRDWCDACEAWTPHEVKVSARGEKDEMLICFHCDKVSWR